MFARSRKKPLWKLVVDFSPVSFPSRRPFSPRKSLLELTNATLCSQEELVRATAFRYISDAITKEEALTLLRAKEPTKASREALVRSVGYPAYVTSAGWLGYSDEKIATLTKEALAQGFTHFKMKVGANRDDDLRRGKLIRSIIDDPAFVPPHQKLGVDRGPEHPSVVGKNAGPTGSVLMIDANQVWDVPQAIDYVSSLEPIKPWSVPIFLDAFKSLIQSS